MVVIRKDLEYVQLMKLTHWAKKNSVTYRTAWQWFKDGKIPTAYRLPAGPILVADETVNQKQDYVVTYARVSSSENKENLKRQSERLVSFCNAKGWQTHLNVQEIGSGLNDRRKMLLKILDEAKATRLVVEHKDRLARFGVSYIECLCKHIRCELVVVNQQENDREVGNFVKLWHLRQFGKCYTGLKIKPQRTVFV